MKNARHNIPPPESLTPTPSELAENLARARARVAAAMASFADAFETAAAQMAADAAIVERSDDEASLSLRGHRLTVQKDIENLCIQVTLDDQQDIILYHLAVFHHLFLDRQRIFPYFPYEKPDALNVPSYVTWIIKLLTQKH